MTEQPIAIVFPGQGCQRPGMGRDFHERFAAARRTYQEASNACGLDLASICFDHDERLAFTEYAQPAILTTEIAMLRSIESEHGLRASYYGGHSLGEYSALVAAGVIPLAEAARIVRERGRLMQTAVPAGRGRMVAVIDAHLDRQAVERAVAGLEVSIANDNCSDQIVLSGLAGDTRTAETRLVELSGDRPLRFVELDVSAPFHSRLMAGIESRFGRLLAAASSEFDASRATAVTSNYSGGFHDGDTEDLITRLVRQNKATVRWRENMSALAKRSRRIIEIGPGRPLRGFFKTLGVGVETITSVRAAEKVAAAKD